jgi:primosomal replication protein N
MAHVSRQPEAGSDRVVEAEIRCVAVEIDARQIATAPLGIGLRVSGFVAPKGKSSRQLILHVTELRFMEGVQDASP